MATFRCRGCGTLYMRPLDWGGLVPHACAPVVDPATGRLAHRPGHRDENMAQDPRTGTVTFREAGAGCELLDEEDVLLRATPEQLRELQTRAPRDPAPYPDPPPRRAEVWPHGGLTR